jgi:hypothetical protein
MYSTKVTNIGILNFINRYCLLYNISEDDFTSDDVTYIEDTWYSYCETGELPDFMRTN